MAVKLEKFKVDEMEREFFSDSAMIGIICPHPAYHLSWLINNEMGMNFRCVPEMTLEYRSDDATISYFAVYQYLMQDDNYEVLLYKVKNDTTFLFPRWKKGNWMNNIDYLFLLKTADPEKDAAELSAKLSKLSGISLSLTVDADHIKHLENLLV